MERENFLKILKEMSLVCKRVTKEYNEQTKEKDIQFEVLQFSDIARHWDSVMKVADFYNKNWTQNKDFMHIPDFMQVLENCRRYPVIIAREEGKEDILAISTIKYEKNTEEQLDPYFPEPGANYFSITGILARKDSPYKGLGKKIYEIAMLGAHEYAKEYPGTRLTCVIDCRNRHSLNAVAKAAEAIRENGLVGEGKELNANILGYYELREKENNQLIEAPTLVLEIELEEQPVQEKQQENVLSYEAKEPVSLFDGLLQTLKQRLHTYGLNAPTVMEDEGCGIVSYYSLQEPRQCSVEKTVLKPNGTEIGNNREIQDDSKMRNFIGPIPPITIEEEER